MKALALIAMLTLSLNAFAQGYNEVDYSAPEYNQPVDDLDPNDANIESILLDNHYDATGEELNPLSLFIEKIGGCSGTGCAVYVHVSKASQRISVSVNGSPIGLPDSRTSTGLLGPTPNMSGHFAAGRIHTRYSSNKFPGGDWNGLGNMPYAMFIRGGFAIHGTPAGNWGKLGRPASHGCIRVHPLTAKLINGLVRQYGTQNTWVVVN